jgi:hypothetical protein
MAVLDDAGRNAEGTRGRTRPMSAKGFSEIFSGHGAPAWHFRARDAIPPRIQT